MRRRKPGGEEMGILLDEKNKEAWLGELEKEEREEMKASSELMELEGKL